MAAIAKICVSCNKLFYPAQDDHNTLCAVGKTMLAEFYECDDCINQAEYEMPIETFQTKTLASAHNTPRAWTPEL